jgi:nucleotide-binding universal stress UspA family protein
MIRLQKILFPTDFSDLSGHALSYARSFAENYRAELHILHVVDDAYMYVMPIAQGSLPVGPPLADLIKLADAELDRLRTKHFTGPSPPIVLASVSGRPFMEIINYAAQHAIDMIIMGTHGRSALRHVLLGSVTEKVVRRAPCPVLTIRHPEHEFVMP